MPINPVVQQGILQALAGGATGKVPAPGPAALVAKTPEEEDKPGFFDRMFPDRDPNTGKQGGILANPLFRIGLNLLQRSGPQRSPTSLGQVIAGSIGDYAQQRDAETVGADNYMQLRNRQQAWGDDQGKREWAKDINFEELLALGNPTGNPAATKVQVQGPLAAPRLGPIPKGYASYAPLISQAEQQNPDLPKGLLPALLEQESSFRPDAVGPDVKGKGGKVWNARGIAQFSPDTAARFGIDPFNPEQAIPTAAIYLREELRKAGGDLDKALAIYGGGFVNGQITPNGRKYIDVVKSRMAKYQGGGAALPGSPPPPPPAQFPEAAAPPAPTQLQAPSQFSGSGFSMPGAETPGYPAQPQVQPRVASSVQPQVVPPQSPAVQPVGGAPLPAQSQAAPPVSGEAMAPAGEPVPPPVPPLQFDEKGRPTKASILDALKALPIENRNQLITGAWLKAAGNKKEFAENLGTALLAQGLQRSRGGVGGNSRFQQRDILLPNGRVESGSYDPDDGKMYIPGPDGELVRAPYGSRPATASMGGPISADKLNKIDTQLTEDEIGLKKIDRYMRRVGDTNIGLRRWADEISQHIKTLFAKGELTNEELNRAVATGDLEALIGLFRIDVVGPGVMTAQDAIFVKEVLGGNVGILQNPEVLAERLRLLLEQKYERMQPNLRTYNENAKYFGREQRTINVPDIESWGNLKAIKEQKGETTNSSTTTKPLAPGKTPGGHTYKVVQ